VGLFASSGLIFRRGTGADYPVCLRSVRGGDTLFALVSTPVAAARGRVGKLDSTLLTQPRVALLDDLQRHFVTESPRRGLPPGGLRRVKEYVAAHLAEGLSLEKLAAHAGLSVHHFARAFKLSTGMPPHRYLLEQRIQKAAELLERTGQPIVDIALAVGFADQAHFSRSFHSLAGLTPSQFRRAHR
jgi:AraC-like DNA-binding protein